jgi:prepilin-type N-terminal cleavage/methylation domain-containing protein
MAFSPKQIGRSKATPRKPRGFTLIELLLSMFILMVFSGLVFQQIIQLQKRATTESATLDMNQQAREFVDQTVRDLHMSGYPSASMYSNPAIDPSKVAAGLVSVSPTQILMEGDVNNDGTVQSVSISYVASDPNDPNCPCIRRSAITKTPAGSLNQPTTPYYTETQFVLSPGTGPGQSGEDLFAYYDQNGTQIDVTGGVDISVPAGPTTPSGQSIISSIKTIKINLSLLNRQPGENSITRTSMSATARLN